MASQALFAKGTKLWRKDPSTLIYELVPQMMVLTTPSPSFDEDEITNHDSPGNAKEFIQTLFDQGAIPITILWHPAIAMHVQLYSDMNNNVNLDWRIVLPDPGSATFAGPGYLRNLTGELNVSSAVRMAGEIRCSALWELTV